jgi:hypothetical protein
MGLRCGHAFPGFDAPGCVYCGLWLRVPAYRAKVAGADAPERKPVEVSLPCGHRGRELTGHERETAGLDHARIWLYCEHPAKPLGPTVCGCAGCGPSCPGYASPIA